MHSKKPCLEPTSWLLSFDHYILLYQTIVHQAYLTPRAPKSVALVLNDLLGFSVIADDFVF